MNKKYDIFCLGNALLDIVFYIDDKTLDALGLIKASMQLIDKSKSDKMIKLLKTSGIMPKAVSPGGSSANTAVSARNLGSKVFFAGAIGKDTMGKKYKSATVNSGVLTSLACDNNLATGVALTFITPDGERTFATHLGASSTIKPSDINEKVLAQCKILHIEGYMLEDTNLYKTTLHAIKIAKKYDLKISIDVSDPSLIGRIKEKIEFILKNYVDIVFANEQEAYTLTGKNSTDALNVLSKLCQMTIVKLGSNGSMIKYYDNVYNIQPHKVKVNNTNGAGDIYAGAMLHCLINELPIEIAGDIASFCGSRAVLSDFARVDKQTNDEIRAYLASRN